MHPAIFYQNASKSVTVLDLPRSIAQGQRTSATLCSSPAPECPYPSTEPKGWKREKLLATTPGAEREYHSGIHELLECALSEARSNIGDSDWCYPRTEQCAPPVEVSQLTTDRCEDQLRAPQPPLLLSAFENHIPDLDSMRYLLMANTLGSKALLTAEAHSFHVPPLSVSLCSPIADGLWLMGDALKSQTLAIGTNGCGSRFDFVLLDPPWANRSVRNAKSYKMTDAQRDPFQEVLPMLASSITPNGIVAIWVTNKADVRDIVLRSMKRISFELLGQWVWLKVTRRGDPVTALDGVWRKPYEVLLLFSKSSTTSMQGRTLIAVPDLHSRKPCLKELIDPFLPHPYRALEVFSRYLTAGWWSWGDECLKYQHTSQWVPRAKLASRLLP